jgi:phage gp45-like
MAADISAATERLYGKFPGVVAANTPTGAADDFQGNIRVRVHTILGDGNQPIEVWAMPCFHPGFFFIPEKGDNVWVEFIGGDINHAVWTGVWYPQGKTPKTAAGDAPSNENKVIRTASGHVIELTDTSGGEKVVIRHTSGSVVELNKDGSVLVANEKGSFLYLNADGEEVTLMEAQGNLLTMSEKRVLVANADGTSLEMKEGKVKVTSADAVQLMAKDVVVNSSTVSLGQNAMQPAVLGTVFAAMYNAHTHPTAVGPSGPPIPVPMPLGPSPGGMGLSRAVKVAE